MFFNKKNKQSKFPKTEKMVADMQQKMELLVPEVKVIPKVHEIASLHCSLPKDHKGHCGIVSSNGNMLFTWWMTSDPGTMTSIWNLDLSQYTPPENKSDIKIILDEEPNDVTV